MKTGIVNLLKILAIVYVLLCCLLYFIQEKLIFFPQKLAADYKFTFNRRFQELPFKTPDGSILHGLLFTADSSKGLIFYLHGNAGSLASWGEVQKLIRMRAMIFLCWIIVVMERAGAAYTMRTSFMMMCSLPMIASEKNMMKKTLLYWATQ